MAGPTAAAAAEMLVGLSFQHLFTVFLTLRFDGAFRPPRDPGFPTKSVRRVASSSAAIWKEDEELVSIGGRRIDILPDMTSTDMEFKGLLLGLEWLAGQDSDWWKHHNKEQLRVCGDCKTIIDQFNGDSIPRKLQSQHEAAAVFLDKLPCPSVVFEYIPRLQNQLCDGVCSSIIANVCVEAIDWFETTLTKIEPVVQSDEDKSPLCRLLDRHFAQDGTSLVPLSVRPHLLEELVGVARRQGDYRSILLAGQYMESNGKSFPTIDQKRTGPSKESLTAAAIRLQIEGYDLLGKHKERDRLTRKHRVLLRRFAVETTLQSSGAAVPTITATTAHHAQNHTNDPPLTIDTERDGLERWKSVFARQQKERALRQDKELQNDV